MLKKNFVKALGLSLLLASQAQALTLDWSGGYRAEWTEVDRPSLDTPSQRKSYGLNYLYLSPKIIAADGINITSRFDILNSQQYPGSQLGTIWGFDGSTGATDSSATNNNMGAAQVSISQLYLTINQEYGALIVGRAPLDFGVGMAYSSGQGAFDHWYDTRDLIAYKIVFGDWFLMPILTRSASTYEFGQGGSITAMGGLLQYENKENQSLIGVLMESKKGSMGALGYTPSQIAAYGGDAVSSGLSIQSTHFVLGRGFDGFAFKLEAGFLAGETGITRAGDDVGVNGYGIAAEIAFPRPESKWDFTAKFGMATGDDPGTTDFDAYAFDQNYDVAMLMFNHRMGQKDFMNTNVYRPNTTPGGAAAGTMEGADNSADDEYLSNAIYVAPSALYRWNDRFDVRNTLVWAQLMQTQKNSVDSSKDLGLEWDIELIYRPSDRIQWVNQVGLLFPGEAWKNGNDDFGNGFNFGFASKAAISF
ncbi:hypothetical protein [Bdellovibrio sp. HCB2-146]|uniref:hypothetical protein n=1 Tax=Bdellovibrio sp. HCB2-146 TaxID=3394362 RepID=UPI0039BD4EA4